MVHRKSGVSALLWYVMRGASLKLHSRAEQVLRLLMDDSTLNIGDKFVEGKVFYLDSSLYMLHYVLPLGISLSLSFGLI